MLRGGDGADLLVGGRGGDDVDGGPGRDQAAYDSVLPVTVDLADPCDDGSADDERRTAKAGSACPLGARDSLTSIDELSGTPGGDTMVGTAADETLLAGFGDDTLEGGPDRDSLIGGAGADVLLARDGVVDASLQCQVLISAPEPGDRAVADPDDPVGSCASVERGGVQGPAVGPAPSGGGGGGAPPVTTPPAGGTPTPFAPPAEVVVGQSGTTEPGAGPGGGLPGRPPELRLLSPVALLHRDGSISVRLACVYRAKACSSTLTLEATTTLQATKGGRRIRVPAGMVLARSAADIPWGTSKGLRVRLSRDARSILAAGRAPLDVRVRVVAVDSAQGRQAVPLNLTGRLRIGAGR